MFLGIDEFVFVLVVYEILRGVQLCFVIGMIIEYDGVFDVMWGEEIQIVGVFVVGFGDGVYVMLGMYSKWISV